MRPFLPPYAQVWHPGAHGSKMHKRTWDVRLDLLCATVALGHAVCGLVLVGARDGLLEALSHGASLAMASCDDRREGGQAEQGQGSARMSEGNSVRLVHEEYKAGYANGCSFTGRQALALKANLSACTCSEHYPAACMGCLC
jgi:hypothetical protein